MPAAFDGDAPIGRSVREILRDLRLVAAEAVLEDDRHARPAVEDAKGRVVALQRSGPHRDISPERYAATPGASSAVSPCVTSGPSKPAAPSRATKSGKSTTPLPAVVKRPSAERSLAWAMAIAVAERSTAAATMARASARSRLLEQVGRIEHDAQPRRAHLGDQPHRVGRRGDDVGLFRLDAEIDAVRLGESARACAISPAMSAHAGGLGIVRMMRPLVLGIARAGAQA